MHWISENWSLIAVIAIIAFYFVLSGKQSVRNWLLMAVSLAEKEMGSGTGRLKLVQVYSDFVTKYPVFSKIVPFVLFSAWVDSALAEMRHLLETNENIFAYIEGNKD